MKKFVLWGKNQLYFWLSAKIWNWDGYNFLLGKQTLRILRKHFPVHFLQFYISLTRFSKYKENQFTQKTYWFPQTLKLWKINLPQRWIGRNLIELKCDFPFPHIENYASFQNKDGFRNKVINFKQVFYAPHKLRVSTSNDYEKIILAG